MLVCNSIMLYNVFDAVCRRIALRFAVIIIKFHNSNKKKNTIFIAP